MILIKRMTKRLQKGWILMTLKENWKRKGFNNWWKNQNSSQIQFLFYFNCNKSISTSALKMRSKCHKEIHLLVYIRVLHLELKKSDLIQSPEKKKLRTVLLRNFGLIWCIICNFLCLSLKVKLRNCCISKIFKKKNLKKSKKVNMILWQIYCLECSTKKK